MSWLSNATGIHIGFGPKKASTALPPSLQNASPQAQQGYEQMIGALNGEIGGAQKMNNIAGGITGAAMTPVALGALGVGGGSAAGAAGTAAGAGTDTTGAGGSSSSLPSWLQTALGGLGTAAGDVGSFLKNNSGSLIEGANVAEAALRQQQATDYAKQALSTAQDAYNAKSGLRSAGIAGMLNPSAKAPNLSALQNLAGAGSGNPFARGLPLASPAPGAGTSAALPLGPPPGQSSQLIANGPPPASDISALQASVPKLSMPMPTGAANGGVLGSIAGALNGQPSTPQPGALPLAGALQNSASGVAPGGILGSIQGMLNAPKPQAPLPLAGNQPQTPQPITPPITAPGLGQMAPALRMAV